MRPGPVFVGLLIAAAQAAPAAAQNTFKTADWVGGTAFRESEFTGCYVGRSYSDGTKVQFHLTAKLELYMGASKSTWKFNPEQKFEMTFEIDGGFKKAYPGFVDRQNRSMIWFTIGNDPELRRAIAGNGTLTWVDPKGLRFPFSMANGDNAMRKLIACAALFGVD